MLPLVNLQLPIFFLKNGLPTNVENKLIPSEMFYLGRDIG